MSKVGREYSARARAKRAATVWALVRWQKALDMGALRQRCLKEHPGALAARASLEALAQKQAGRFGAVMCGGHEIARRGGISESTWWHTALPQLEAWGLLRRAERGGGRVKGGDGRANVYMAVSEQGDEAERRAQAAWRERREAELELARWRGVPRPPKPAAGATMPETEARWKELAAWERANGPPR